MSQAGLPHPGGRAFSGWMQFLPALLFAAFSAAALAAPMHAPETGEMAVIFPPFTTEETAWALVRDAGGAFVAPTRIPNIVVVHAPDDGFQHRMRDMGAVFFLAANGLCAPLFSS